MTKIITAFGFLLVLSLFTVGISTGFLQNVEAQRDPDIDTQCRTGQVLVYHFNFRKYICTSESGANRWVTHGIAEIIGEPETMKPDVEQVDKADFAKRSDEKTRMAEIDAIFDKIAAGERLSKGEERMAKRFQQFTSSEITAEEYYKTNSQDIPVTTESTAYTARHGMHGSATITSQDDPGIGHEGEELAMILPPSDMMYIGKITFSASEPVQYVSLIGPLGPGEDGGQPIWELADGTKYAIVMVDNGLKSGGWYFAGNALALHTMNPDPFTATYSVAYSELEPGEYPKGTVDIGTVQSIQDPGIGHESHSIVLLLPLRDIPYQGGVVAYSVSERVQLVALHGPLKAGEDKGQATWTADGETVYALTLIEDLDNVGVWTTFSGNALALHTMNPDGFTASYALGGLH